VCRDWAAVHADSSSGIWEAVNLHAETQRMAEKEVLPGDAVRLEAEQRGLVSLGVWLAARAQAVRQLQFCETDVGVTAAPRTALVRCRCPAKIGRLSQDRSGLAFTRVTAVLPSEGQPWVKTACSAWSTSELWQGAREQDWLFDLRRPPLANAQPVRCGPLFAGKG